MHSSCSSERGFAEFSCKPNAESLLYAEAPPKIATFPEEKAEVLRKLSESSLLQLNAAKTLAKTLKGDLRK